MDFLARQRLLDTSSRHLLVGYVFIVMALSAGLALTCMGLIFYTAWSRSSFHPDATTYGWSAVIGGVSALVVLAVTTWLSYRRLNAGLQTLVRDLGATQVRSTDQQPAERRLYHVVEEMALAAQQPIPHIYLLADEPGINASALGHSARDAALIVTLGCLYRLKRDELQAVIAHGFSDLGHGDPALRLRLAALVGGLQSVSKMGLFLLVPVRSRKRGGGVNPFILAVYPLCAMIGLNLLIGGSLAWLLGELLGAAVMRRRTLAGDLIASQFTRNPVALAQALSKVGGFVFGSRLLSPSARDYRHLFLCRTSGPTVSMLDAHPPLWLRVSSLDPAWDRLFSPSRIDTWLIDQLASGQSGQSTTERPPS